MTVDARFLADTLTRAGQLLGARLTDAQPLAGSDRSVVVRCRAGRWGREAGRGTAGSVVVKRYPDGPEAGRSAARERIGLAALGAGAQGCVPRLLAADVEQRLVVMTDVGTGPTLADLLLGQDGAAAWTGALNWAAALGEALGRSHGQAAATSAALADAGVPDLDGAAAARAGAERLTALLGAPADARRTAALADELAGMAVLGARDAVRGGPPADVVSPGDTCPDNAVLTADGWRFVDLEGAGVQHVALDAAYTVLPFATCWCVFEPPAGLTDAMLDRFTGALASYLPDVVAGPGWSHLIDLACAGWILAMTGWLLDGALEDRPLVGPAGRPSPSYRALLAARWQWGAARLATATPAVAALLGDAAAWAHDAWPVPPGSRPADGTSARGAGSHRLPPYPAFG